MMKIRTHLKNNWLSSTYTLQQEASIYDAQLVDILENTRWYLDNFEGMQTYRVSWINYGHCRATLPLGELLKDGRSSRKYRQKSGNRKLYK